MSTGYDPRTVAVPKRFIEIVAWKGAMDENYLKRLMDEYSKRIEEMGCGGKPEVKVKAL